MEATCGVKYRLTNGALDLVRVVSPTGKGVTVRGGGIPAAVAAKVLGSGAKLFDTRHDLVGDQVYYSEWWEGTVSLTYGEMRAVLAGCS